MQVVLSLLRKDLVETFFANSFVIVLDKNFEILSNFL